MSARIVCPVRDNARKHGDRIAVISKEHPFSYRQLEESLNVAEENLQRLGVKRAERIALIGPNSVEYLIALFALWRQGAVVCLLSTRLPPEGLRSCLKTISCTRIYSPEEIFIPGTRTKQKVDVPEYAPEYALNDPADIMFTSGSSGEPKAAVHSFGNHYDNAQAANDHIPVAAGDRWLLSLPLYHVGGLGIIWRTFLAGGTVVVPQDSEDIAESLRKYKITHVSVVPTQLHRLLGVAKNIPLLQKLKAILIGGSPVPEALIRKSIDAGLPLYVTYGLTENASQVAASGQLTKDNPLPSAKVLKNTEVRISKEHEILVKGKTLFQGYVDGEKVEPALDRQGWFHTGDLGCLNEDGTLTVLGRKDNMFISGGENIQPEEIERHLCRIEGVIQAVVVPVKSEEFGSRPAAFIQVKEGTQVSRTQILSFLRQYLPSFKLPDQIYPWPKMPQGLKPNRSCFLQLIKDSSSGEKGIIGDVVTV